MSARISGVKNFESKAVSLLRGLPLSQVQSQSENGAIFSLFVGAAKESLDGCANTASAGAATGKVTAALSEVSAAREASAAARTFSSASSCSMRAFMAASSFAISSELSGFGGTTDRLGATSGDG